MRSASILLITFLFFFSCMPVRVTTEKVDDSTFLGYETYNFYDIEFQRYDSLPYTKENMDFLLEEIRDEMFNKGFELDDDPDLFLNIGVVVKMQEQTRETDPRFDMNYIGQRTYRWERQEVVTGTYEEGAITIDFVNADTNRLIWQGTAVGILTNDIEKMRKRASYAIEKIFSKMPIY
jgi:hypothetical protein